MRTAMQRRNPVTAASSQGHSNNDHQQGGGGSLMEEETKPLAITPTAASSSANTESNSNNNGGAVGDGAVCVDLESSNYSNAKPAFGSYLSRCRNTNKRVVVRSMLAFAAAFIIFSLISKSSAPKPRPRKYDHSSTSTTSTLSSSMSLTYSAMGDIGKNNKSKVGRSFDLAFQQSFGFLDDIPNSSWMLMQDRVKQSINHLYPNEPLKEQWLPWRWYQDNWEPTFACQHERRIGGTGMGDGPKWVCNPHRIAEMAAERSKKKDEAKCLIYSVGSNGDFQFEEGLHELLGTELCEVHVFDPKDFSADVPADIDEFVHFHPWGIISQDDSPSSSSNFKNLPEIVETLGHAGRTIDIFKIDCEGCEWNTFDDWFASGLDIRQILVEVHNVPDNVNDFFEALQDEGFVTFHKEPNTKYSGGMCQEYAFLKLHPDFFV